MSGPRPDPDYVLHTYRVDMKDGSTRVVTAERVEAFGFYALAFLTHGTVVSVLANGSYLSCDKIDPVTNECSEVVSIPAPPKGETERVSGSGNSVAKTAGKGGRGKTKTQMIRSTPAGNRYWDEHETSTDVGRLIGCIDIEKSEGEPIKEVRASFLEEVGGFPPKTYKRFNNVVAVAVEQKLIEVYDLEI